MEAGDDWAREAPGYRRPDPLRTVHLGPSLVDTCCGRTPSAGHVPATSTTGNPSGSVAVTATLVPVRIGARTGLAPTWATSRRPQIAADLVDQQRETGRGRDGCLR